MTLKFTKMQGLGNDFVVINAIDQQFEPSAEQCRQIADRRFGVGCDQILLVERPRDPETAFFYRIFNADGSEVEQCGNGARCFARFVHDEGLSSRREIPVGTRGGTLQLHLESDGQVRVNMGVPILEPDKIPFQADERANSYPLEWSGEVYPIGALSMGNPHAVLQVPDIDTAPVQSLGRELESHPRFPRRVNVGFMQILSPGQIRLRVFERGSGETLACGSGACAAVVTGRLQGLLNERVSVHLPGGDLVIKWAGEQQPVWMSGPAVKVFEGNIAL